ncbi:hypothetical protein AV530_002311 [Patagioenas fasciata monilis]|uniref:Uncharacterized protein n=1 Tax=Patagioenas fasciata monilis TaxID=372326 RepID=A0A1V4K660_PATFA|nr:hypothetical protein AV530_002311 [Patagioenas fasciata monilis]
MEIVEAEMQQRDLRCNLTGEGTAGSGVPWCCVSDVVLELTCPKLKHSKKISSLFCVGLRSLKLKQC